MHEDNVESFEDLLNQAVQVFLKMLGFKYNEHVLSLLTHCDVENSDPRVFYTNQNCPMKYSTILKIEPPRLVNRSARCIVNHELFNTSTHRGKITQLV